MLAEKGSIRRKEKHTAIERSALTLNHAHHQIDMVGSRCLAQCIHRWPGNFHGTLKVALEVFTARVRAPAHHGAKVEPTRIAGDKSFREEHKFGALLRGVACKIQGFGQSPFAVKRNRGSLNHGHGHGAAR